MSSKKYLFCANRLLPSPLTANIKVHNNTTLYLNQGQKWPLILGTQTKYFHPDFVMLWKASMPIGWMVTKGISSSLKMSTQNLELIKKWTFENMSSSFCFLRLLECFYNTLGCWGCLRLTEKGQNKVWPARVTVSVSFTIQLRSKKGWEKCLHIHAAAMLNVKLHKEMAFIYCWKSTSL